MACGSSDGGSTGSTSSSTTGGGSSTTADSKPVDLTFTSYGGAYQEAQQKAFTDPYMKEHPNVTIKQDGPTDYAKLRAMVKTGNVDWDVVLLSSDGGLDSMSDILEPIDCSVVDCADFEPAGPTKYRAPVDTAAMVIDYRKDKFPTPPQGWKDVFDTTKFPGKRCFYKYIGFTGLLEEALIADGVPPDQLYPLDVDRAFKKLDTIKDDIVWYESGADSARLIADGQCTIGHAPNGRVYDVAVTGGDKNVGIQWNQALYATNYLGVPKGANTEEAMKLIAYMTSPEHNAQLSQYIPYSPMSKGAQDKTDPKMKEWLPATHDSQGMFHIDDEYYDKNYTELSQRFTEWLQGG